MTVRLTIPQPGGADRGLVPPDIKAVPPAPQLPLDRALAGSAWLRRTLDAWARRAPALLDEFHELRAAAIEQAQIAALLAKQCNRASAHAGPDQALGIALRQTRQVVVAALLERDVRGVVSLDQVCATMSDLAELATTAAVQHAAAELIERFGLPCDAAGQPMDLQVIGMGKLGARELNVSSDIDLVLVYREEGRTLGGQLPSISCADFFARTGRRLIQQLDEITEEGFVFRVDLRLRPDGSSGPLAIGLPALEDYLSTQGREWERFAWLKSRQIADTGLTSATQRQADLDALLALVHPFVWRRYLDFGAFDALKDLHSRLRAEAAKREARRGGIDVKLGRGGIREIEFIAQLFQIVRGGRDPGLRVRATTPALQELAARGLLPASECAALTADYAWLRRVEHALQYREDAQTHTLPEAREAREQTALLLGLEVAELEQRLAETRTRVAQIFDALLAPSTTAAQGPAEQGQAAPAGALPTPSPVPSSQEPDPPPAPLQARINELLANRRWTDARPETRAALTRLITRLQYLPNDPLGVARIRLIELFESVIGRPSYLLLLDRFPAALDRLARTVARSRWASDYLRRHPIVLDELLDGQILNPVDYNSWVRLLQNQLNGLTLPSGPDVERQMDVARESHHAQVFRLLFQDLEGRLTIERLSDHLSELADRVLELAIALVWPTVCALNRAQSDAAERAAPHFAVIAYGRLGGKELGYASDLDLVFLYDDESQRAGELYAQLAQRLMTWLSSRTGAGILFEVDLRLRPNGNAGLLVCSFEAYARYQRENAWVWEHQALTRARYCAGFSPLGPRFEGLRREVLSRPRNPITLADEVLSMRQKVAAGHPNRSDLFDLKHDRGGLIDVEFAVQYLVLAHAAHHPELLDDVGNIALLERAAQSGLIDRNHARAAGDAYRHYRSLQHGLRLDDAAYARVDPAEVASLRVGVTALWDGIFAKPPNAG
jgi:glutamate-ammonia-ligase adenylyltransferase